MALIWKLCTGEELIGVAKIREDKFITIEKPLQIIMGMGRDGRPALSLFPFLMYADLSSGLKISTDKIVFETEPSLELKNNYTQATTGLVIPDAPPPLQLVT